MGGTMASMLVGSKSWLVRLATWLGCGRAPLAPGTVGTLGAIPLVILMALIGHWPYLIMTTFLCYLTIEVAEKYEVQFDVMDAKEVVIDEVAGYAVAMAWLPLTWQAFLASFILFRLLDMIKPFPINMIDRHGRGGVGVVADDLLAGIVTNIALQVVFVQTTWLGVQFS